MEITRACKCGCQVFHAHQICYFSVLVDAENTVAYKNEIYDTGEPFGTYECTSHNCNCQYESLDELPIFVKLPADLSKIMEYAKDKGFSNPVISKGIWPEHPQIECLVVEDA